MMPKGGSVEIDLRLLRSFVQIHESGSLARASDRLACTPAALSMRLKLLETEIGAPLFIRHPGGLDPTARGAELYARALSVLSAYDEMMSATRSRPLRDRVRIGLPDDYATGWLPGLLTRLGPALDRIEVEVTCDLSAHLMAAVQRQEVDLALVTLAARPARARAAAVRTWMTKFRSKNAWAAGCRPCRLYPISGMTVCRAAALDLCR